MLNFTFKIGEHAGPGGNLNGAGTRWGAMDADGRPVHVKSVDSYGPCFEVANLTESGVDHQVLFRLSNRPNGYHFDTPDYALSPKDAAILHWRETKISLPPEFHKDITWLELTNEVDKNQSEWLAQFFLEIVQMAWADGYKVACFGWSTGEPEPEHWTQPKMLELLTLAGNNPDRLAISLHEYSLSETDIQAQYPWLVGRFGLLHDACDANNIPRPTIFISEWGWTLWKVPEPSVARSQIRWAAELYARHPNIKGVSLWYYGAGYQNIADRAVKLIPVLQAMGMEDGWWSGDPEPPPPPPPPPAYNWMREVWDESVQKQIECGVSLNPSAALQREMVKHGYGIVLSEQRYTRQDGSLIAYQPAERADGQLPRRIYWAPAPHWTPVRWYYESDINDDPSGTVSLNVPYLSQWGADAGTFSGDCGPACVAMIASFFGNPTTVNEAVIATGQTDPHSTHIQNELMPGLEKLGVTPSFVRPLDAAMIQNEIDNGHPIIALLDYEYIPDRQDQNFTGNHFLVIVGYEGDQDFIVNDPDYWGDRINEGNHKRIGVDILMTAMTAAGLQGIVCQKATTPPPPGTAYDLVEYMRGDGRSYELQYTWNGGGTHPVQCHTDGNRFFVVKGDNGEYEELWSDQNFIYRGVDTSEAHDKYYVQYTKLTDGSLRYGAAWAPRYMTIGQEASFSPYVIHYWQADCTKRGPEGQPTNQIKLLEHHDSYTFPSGITLQDVIVLGWPNQEKYWFAKGFSLVGWEGTGVGQSYISEIHDNRPLTRNVPPCL